MSSSDNDNEEFYDAQEISEKSMRSSGKNRASSGVSENPVNTSVDFSEQDIIPERQTECPPISEEETTTATTTVPVVIAEIINDPPESRKTCLNNDIEVKVRHAIQKRHLKLEEARKHMHTDADDEILFDDRSSISTTGSCSSIDGLRINLSHSASCTCGSLGALMCSQLRNEPDLVVSTKASIVSGDQQQFPLPIAPPRRKRKGNHIPAKPTFLDTNKDKEVQGIPSPASTIESLTKEFEHSLDLPSAISGQYVVKPQDDEKTKADGTSQNNPYVLCIDECSIMSDYAFGDEEAITKQLNMVLRTRTDSGKELTDIEILEQITVLNLDTGERIPLSLAEDRLPQGVNPLSLHIMRLTSEYVSNSSLEKVDSDDDSTKSKSFTLPGTLDNIQVKKKTIHLKRLLNRTVEKTVNKIKSVADDVYHVKHNDDMAASECSDDDANADAKKSIKFKSSSSHKGPYEFNNLKLIQDLSGEHLGAVWTMKFSGCGRLLATVGQDHILRIWVLKHSFDYFNDMRNKYNSEARLSPTTSESSFASLNSAEGSEKVYNRFLEALDSDEFMPQIFATKPFCTFVGHTADLLDVSWSKNYFILSSSMDKTVRLWHISRKECLCCFQHIDFVTAIAFHPRDDRYFLSGSLDGKLRLWNIPDKKVALWNELDGQTKLITSANFCQNGKFAVVGTYDGRCIFYTTEQLKYYTQIHVRSTRGKNAKGRKISGIEPMPGEDKILVTSNDSRVRLYDLRDLSLSCKYRGYVNLSSQIRASFSHDGKYIVTGSENQNIYLWKTQHDYAKFSSARKDRNDYWESIKVHNAVVTAAVFAPNPRMIFHQMEQQCLQSSAATSSGDQLALHPAIDVTCQSHLPSMGLADGYILVTADFSGGVKVFMNKIKLQQKDA